ncbi:MAG: Uma2 family endonuclease [Clostridia bacterium]|nr:MAG: Uma2 family endonuclease [Clostridia bacterium]
MITSAAQAEAAVSQERFGPFTYEDYLLFPEDGRRHELIGGEHYVTPAPTTVHQRFLGNLYSVLRQYVLAHQWGEIFFAPVDIILSNRDVVQPDLLFLSSERLGRLGRENVKGAPDLVVEVVSESSRYQDKKLKKSLYASHDVHEYWLADPELQVLEVYRRDEANQLVKVAEYEDGGELTSPLFPDLRIDVATLWP